LTGPYNPQVEAISPTLPNDELRDEIKQSKDELLQSINRIDREIAKNDQAISKLRLKQVNFQVILNIYYYYDDDDDDDNVTDTAP